MLTPPRPTLMLSIDATLRRYLQRATGMAPSRPGQRQPDEVTDAPVEDAPFHYPRAVRQTMGTPPQRRIRASSETSRRP